MKGDKVHITVRVQVRGLQRLRWLIDDMAVRSGLADPCDRCGGAIYPDLPHSCPIVIDVVEKFMNSLPDRTDP